MKRNLFSPAEVWAVIKNYQNYSTPWAVVLSVIALSMALFHLYFNSYGRILSIELRAAHLAFVLALIFLTIPAFKKNKGARAPGLVSVVLALLGAYCALHMFRMYQVFAVTGDLPNNYDLWVAVIGIALLFEAVRRATGWPLVILAIIFILYAKYGNLAPGGFKIAPFSTFRILHQLFYTETGIFGLVLGVSATFIFLFIMLGAFLGENKSSQLFNDISLAAAGHISGGPGLVAVLGSALMGTISGSAVANVATTGTITIPLMKKVGYKSEFAGAVEAVASSGGSIMPPVMASAAFIMAEMLGVPYTRVILAAFIPAVLYYLALVAMLLLEARKNDMKGLPKEDLPSLKAVLKARGHLLIPVAAVMYLLISGRTPLFAGFWGIVLTVVVSWFRADTRMSLAAVVRALREGAFSSLIPAAACAVVGIIVGVASMTGVGTMLAGNIVEAAGGSLAIALVLTMFACLILGMGLPTAACYITAAVVAAPALIRLGVMPIAAHMFVLYYAILSNLTPPVAVASFTAAGIAESSPNKVALTGLRLGSAGFIVPIMFCYSPILLLQGDFAWSEALLAVVTAMVGVLCLGVALQRYLLTHLNLLEAAVFLAVAILMIKPGLTTDLIGLGLLLVGVLSQYLKIGKTETGTA